MSKHHSEFETVYQKHRTAIFHTALSFVRDPAIAEDITHDVFLSFGWSVTATIYHLTALSLSGNATINRF